MARAILVSLIVLAVGLSGPVIASDSDHAECDKQISALTERVEALERKLQAMQVPKTAKAPPPPTRKAKPQSQQDGLELYKEIDLLLAAGEIEKANEALDAKRDVYVEGQQASWIRTLSREMEVVGKPVPSSWGIEKWYQGETEADLDHGTTLLIFWESWCPHCKNEVPRLQSIHEQFRGQGLSVVGLTRISKTATEAAVVSFLDERQIDYPIAKETGEVAEYFNVKGIPAAAVVKDGVIVWRGHPLRLTDGMLKGWL